MRILVAGAIGRPFVRCLKENRHVVFALPRAPQSSRAVAELGAERHCRCTRRSVGQIARVWPDAIINELASLSRHYTAAEMKLLRNASTRSGSKATRTAPCATGYAQLPQPSTCTSRNSLRNFPPGSYTPTSSRNDGSFG
jgi:hypothetical protein